MSKFKIHSVQISAISACVPLQVKKVSEYSYISEKERTLFTKSTGIITTRIADKNTTTVDMCMASANQILKKYSKEEIDIVVFVSQSPDYFLPASSVLIQDRLGLNNKTLAFDINLGCSGYIYGLAVISNLLSLPGMNKALLLCGDKSSLSTNPKDKSTYPLFGDAGTATLLEKNENASPLYFNLQTDGSGKEAIMIKGGATKFPIDKHTLDEKEIEKGIIRSERDLVLDGIEVFNFALREVKPNIVDLLDFAETNEKEIDYFVFHQANRLMNESVRKKLKIDPKKVPYSIQDYGNTSSASIPLTMVTQLKKELAENHEIVLSGFGVGFSWGSLYTKSQHIDIFDLIEI